MSSRAYVNSIEQLERRVLMSTGLTVYTTGTLALAQNPFTLTSKGTLLVQGTDNADRITVYAKASGAGTIVVQNRGDTSPFSIEYRFTPSQVKRIRIDGGGRNDILRVDGNLDTPATLSGGSGNDAIYGGPLGGQVLLGNDGDDYIEAVHPTAVKFVSGTGTNSGRWIFSDSARGSEIHGNVGKDTIMTSAAADTIFGDGGQDALLVPNVSAISLSDPSPGDTLTSIELFAPSLPALRTLSGGGDVVRVGDTFQVIGTTLG